MSLSARIGELAADERGAVLVTFALFAPVVILMAAFTMDAGNWLLHKRHLQVQADAAVFAAAQEYTQPNCAESVDTTIYDRAGQYGGVSSVSTPTVTGTSFTPLFNEQVGGTPQSRVHALINSSHYYNQASPADTTVVAKRPCQAGMIDAKLTETDIPWYWKAFSSVPYINAHARIEFFHQTMGTGVSPLAVGESAPVAVEAYFVNEDKSNTVIAAKPLTKIGSSEGQDIWTNSESPAEVSLAKTNATTAHIGVVIALSGKAGDTTCGHQYVECFGQHTEKEKASVELYEPLLHIAGYSTEGSGSVKAPLARQVKLAALTCTDGYFSTSSSTCKFQITAKVDYGSSNTEGVNVFPVVGGTKGKVLKPENGEWVGEANLPAGTGSNEVSLIFECKKKANSPCPTEEPKPTTISDVHRIFAGSEARSGTIAGAWLSEDGIVGANTFPVCTSCKHKLVVKLRVGGSLAAAQEFSEPTHLIHFEGPQNAKVDCPPDTKHSASEYANFLETGCPPAQINKSDPECTVKPTPYDCVSINNGKATGQTRKGIDNRIERGPGKHFYCPNRWIDSNNGGVPTLPSDDSRVIQIFIVPYGNTGGDVPIQDFAAFYVVGFPEDTCASDPKTGNTEIVGYFIKYINETGGGNREEECSKDPIGECVGLLTR